MRDPTTAYQVDPQDTDHTLHSGPNGAFTYGTTFTGNIPAS